MCYWKTVEGRIKCNWGPHAALRKVLENHCCKEGCTRVIWLSYLLSSGTLFTATVSHKPDVTEPEWLRPVSAIFAGAGAVSGVGIFTKNRTRRRSRSVFFSFDRSRIIALITLNLLWQATCWINILVVFTCFKLAQWKCSAGWLDERSWETGDFFQAGTDKPNARLLYHMKFILWIRQLLEVYLCSLFCFERYSQFVVFSEMHNTICTLPLQCNNSK